MKLGIVNEPMEQYHAFKEAFGSSAFKAAKKNLETFKAYLDGHMDKETQALDIGKKIHSAILEQDLSLFARMPNDDGRTKDFKVAKESALELGLTPMKPQEFEMVEAMFRRFLLSKKAVNMVDGCDIEKSHYTKHPSGLYLKTRPDAVGTDYIVNYKSARDVSRDSFSRDIFNFDYHLSAAHEIKVVESVRDIKIKFYFFIVQEKQAPFGLKIYQLGKEDLERAEAIHEQLCVDIAYAMKTNTYPGYSDQIEVIYIPEYLSNREEKDHEQEPSFDVAQ